MTIRPLRSGSIKFYSSVSRATRARPLTIRVLSADSYAGLRYPFVRSFAIGRFAAIAGWQMINVAVGWQLYERTGDAWALGLVGVAELTPVLLFMVIAGNAADRYPRRSIGIAAHSVLTVAAIGLALLSGSTDRPGDLRVLFMVGASRAFSAPSSTPSCRNCCRRRSSPTSTRGSPRRSSWR